VRRKMVQGCLHCERQSETTDSIQYRVADTQRPSGGGRVLAA
jgi:hypothetical protein